MAKTNLLAETLGVLKRSGKAPADVRWVGVNTGGWNKSTPVSCPWNEFAQHADITYDNGYGGAEIAGSLKIVGDDWWLERGEYDGSEWWEFKSLPIQPGRAVLQADDLLDK